MPDDSHGSASGDGHLARARVLVLEDNLIIGVDIAELVRGFGVRDAVLVAGVRDALDAIAAGDVTVALLDLRLADDGTSLPVAEALVRAGIPFAVVTGLSPRAVLPEPLASAPLLEKPFEADELRALIALLLGPESGYPAA